MSTLTSSSRFKPTARTIFPGRISAATAFSPFDETSSPQRSASHEELKNISVAPQFSATPRFRVLMAMDPARLSGDEESTHRLFEKHLPNLEFKGGVASLNHHWEKLGFAINFIAIVTAIAYVMLT